MDILCYLKSCAIIGAYKRATTAGNTTVGNTTVSNRRNDYLQVIQAQLVLGLLAFLVLTCGYYDSAASAAAGVGVILGVLPSVVYVMVVWHSYTRPLARVYAAHKKAMLLKFISNIAFFMLLLASYHGAYLLVLFISYGITLSGSWLALVLKRS